MSDIDITIRTIVDKAIDDLNNVKKAVEGVGKAETTTKKPTDDTGLSFGKLLGFATKAGIAVYGVKKVYDATVGSTLNYAKQVKDLSRLTGASAEESSKLIQVAEDTEVEYGTLSAALEAAIRNGVKPTVEGISELSARYLEIKDPTERAAFAMKIFGKNGADMMPFLELGPGRIKALGIEAEKYGTILDEKAIGATAAFKDKMDVLENKVEGLKIKIGTGLIPVISDLIDALMREPEPGKGVFGMLEKIQGPGYRGGLLAGGIGGMLNPAKGGATGGGGIADVTSQLGSHFAKLSSDDTWKKINSSMMTLSTGGLKAITDGMGEGAADSQLILDNFNRLNNKTLKIKVLYTLAPGSIPVPK